MRPLPAVLLDLHEDLATGKLQLRRGRVAKMVDLVNGNPVSTASTPRDETLGHFLVGSGVITEEEHRRAVERAATIGGKLGEQLVSLQILTVEQLIDQLGKQARHKLVQALRWPQGAWRFDEAYESVEGMQLRMVEVVLGGLRETAVEDLGRLARLDGMSFELTARGKRLRHELKRSFGDRPLTILSAGGPIGDIEKAFGDRVQARIAIDAMLMCDAIVTKGAQLGLGVAKPISKTIVDDPDEPELYELLFEDVSVGRAMTGQAPLDYESLGVESIAQDDSGVVTTGELTAAAVKREHASAASKALAAEHQRIQGADHYAILLIDRDANADDVEAAYQVKLAMLERSTKAVTDPYDRTKLDEIRAAYASAQAVLTDDRKRAAYARELAGGELVQVPPSIDAELEFRRAEELIAKQQWDQAIGVLRTVLARAPNEAEYHAALGWAEWHAAGHTEAAAAVARGLLDTALSINPDHSGAHDYKGRIEAALRVDETSALFHLERALDLDPMLPEAAATIEGLLVARGELRRLERVLKRLLFRLRGKGGVVEARAWARLARLYLEHLDDAASAAGAVVNARKLAPNHPEVTALDRRADRDASEPIRTGWREALGDPQSGAALVRTTAAAGHGDVAFLAASTMIALGTADDSMAALYEEQRVRAVALPQLPLGRDQWSLLRHRDDTVDLGALLELVAPAVHALAPMTLADGELDASQLVADTELPPAFSWLRAQLATIVGVADAPVYAKVELGAQIHVVACDPPVLVAGDEALTAPERPELVFRMARAMTFLWPGRAVGASRPGRVLRAVVLAIVREAAGTELGLDDPLAPQAKEAVAALPTQVHDAARAAALRLLSRTGGGLNLSLWARSLSRTADRAGMLLCGDVPASFAGAKEVGELDKDLVEFAYSPAHATLRHQLGLTRP